MNYNKLIPELRQLIDDTVRLRLAAKYPDQRAVITRRFNNEINLRGFGSIRFELIGIAWARQQVLAPQPVAEVQWIDPEKAGYPPADCDVWIYEQTYGALIDYYTVEGLELR